MLTPCIKICRAENGRCIGCGRTLEEIGIWRDLGDMQRRRIMARLLMEGYPGSAGTQPETTPTSRPPREQGQHDTLGAQPGPEITFRPACRRYPRAVLIDGIPYGERVVALVEALQKIADGDLAAKTCESIARRALGRQG
ncbi:DUF1289 domain-containing protein [Ectothiorhodospira shaposhnikovii]|uniref:DUF1289 domain-containing protein n=1 Tax=Ectothiorhodospira shaposhnikovii TaxID=1054 RepID=UPI001EE890F6|nr:DUF1289 domain-containing protein [Ectothiorhodospira shaposhnikovii]MCG5513984.1 DUF1289 domain-containing protein [Ectothiorhodospira shaposhnikovii]